MKGKQGRGRASMLCFPGLSEQTRTSARCSGLNTLCCCGCQRPCKPLLMSSFPIRGGQGPEEFEKPARQQAQDVTGTALLSAALAGLPTKCPRLVFCVQKALFWPEWSQFKRRLSRKSRPKNLPFNLRREEWRGEVRRFVGFMA